MLLLGRGLRNGYRELEIRGQLMRASGLLGGVFRDRVGMNGQPGRSLSLSSDFCWS